MQGILYEDPSFYVFALVTVAMGGWSAWMTGRAMALTWRSEMKVVLSIIALAVVVRFIHATLFQGALLSVHYYLVDFFVLLAFGLLGYRYTRAGQMTTQYKWIYERTGPLTWRERPSVERSP